MSEHPETFVGRVRGWFRTGRDFLHRDLWTALPERKGARALYRLLRMGVLTVEGFVRSEVFTLSAALTYQVVFAMVPLLAVMLAAFRGFGGLSGTGMGDTLKTFLIKHIASPQQGDEFVSQLNAFIENVNAAAIGVVGFLVLLYTSLSLLNTIEGAFNKIYGLKSHRSLLRRFTVYWMLLTLSPILIAASLTMTTFVQSNMAYTWLTETVPFFGKFSLFIAPYIFAWIAFTAFYIIMPNTRVDFRAALIGALVSGTIWEAMKTGYVWYNTQVVSASKFYGSLGSIPIFLLWVYLSWVIVLFGAEVAFAVQHVGTYVREIGGARISTADRERLALVICVQTVRSFEKGEAPPTAEAVAAALNAPVRVVHEITYQLVSKGVLREVVIRDRKDPGLVPGQDPSVLAARDVLAAVRSFGDPFTLPNGPQATAIYRLVDEAEARAVAALGAVTLRDLAREAPPAPPPA